MKKYLFLCFLLACTSVLFAQIGEGGTPPSFKYPSSLRSVKAPHTVNADINVNELLYQDSIAEKNGSPMRVATIIPLSVNIKNDGEWTTLPNKQRIWQQTIYVPNANSLILGYNDFYIPEGGKLFIYNKNRSQIIGAFTENTNPGGGNFSNQIIYGDEITLEYVESLTSIEEPRIEIEDIGYVYHNIFQEQYDAATGSYTLRPGRSQSCMINVICSEGDNWRNQQRGVVFFVSKLTSTGAWYGCSGSLINNTKNDAAPYVIAAAHCFNIYEDGIFLGITEFNTAQFYFNYEYTNCSQTSGQVSTTQSIVGATAKVITSTSTEADGLLLELYENVPKEWNPYYNGWDISNTASSSGVIIHHPYFDVKKITTYTQTTTTSNVEGINSNSNFWRVIYSPTINGHSVTQGGSSGAPLFSSEGLIIGTLTGGSSYCVEASGYGPYTPDYYAKMYNHWDKFAGKEMKPLLDPLNSGITKLAGYDPNTDVGIETKKGDANAVNLVLFPNPAVETLNVNAKGIINQISIYNLIGASVYTEKGQNSSTAEISVISLPKGIYTVVVDTEEGRYSGKVNIK